MADQIDTRRLLFQQSACEWYIVFHIIFVYIYGFATMKNYISEES